MLCDVRTAHADPEGTFDPSDSGRSKILFHFPLERLWKWHALAVGRRIVSAALSVAAGAIIAFHPGPGLGQMAVIGIAAAFAVLGEQLIEKLIHLKAGGGQ